MALRPVAKGRAAIGFACPSAPPEWEGAQLLGVVTGTVDKPEVHFVGPRPVTPDLLKLADPVHPTEVFRFTAPCQESACGFFRNGRCGVGEAVVQGLTGSDDTPLPRCGIRPDCRWWHEQGPAACRRCSMVVTEDPARPAAFSAALGAN